MSFNVTKNINEIILSRTKLKDGRSSIYLSLTELFHLLDAITQSQQTTHWISVIPFYQNEKSNFQEEFDFGGLYIECRDSVSQEERDCFWLENKFWGWPDAEYNLLDHYVTDDDLKQSVFLCQSNDIQGFQQSLATYKVFLMERGIPQLMKWLYERSHLVDENLPYGYFCFEITSD